MRGRMIQMLAHFLLEAIKVNRQWEKHLESAVKVLSIQDSTAVKYPSEMIAKYKYFQMKEN